MVNVTLSNFLEQSNDLIRHLPTAAFVALDEEMTGITLPGSKRPCKDDTPSQRFQSNKAVPERYSIIQVGIALFHEDPEYDPSTPNSSEFIVRRYNFYIFPSGNHHTTREVTLNPSAVAFLNNHNMNFDTWTKHGVPYITSSQAQGLFAKHQQEILQQQQQNNDPADAAAGNNNSSFKARPKVELTRTDDISFHARAMASLREWIDSASTATNNNNNNRHAEANRAAGEAAGAVEEEETAGEQDNNNGNDNDNDAEDRSLSFLLPKCNAFLRRALYETIQTEYPSLVLERGGKDAPNQIRAWRLNPQQQEQRRKRIEKQKWEKLMLEQVGFWRVFYALSNACRGLHQENHTALVSSVTELDFTQEPSCTRTGRQVPLVLHNGWMDLLFLMTHMDGHALPESYEDTKALVHEYFPVIYDTKLLSTECSLDATVVLNDGNTTLQNLYNSLVVQDSLGTSPRIKFADQGVDNDRALSEQAHEAEYDAYMTGAVYTALCKNVLNRHCGNDLIRTWRTFGGGDQEDEDDDETCSRTGVGSLVHLLAPMNDGNVRRLFGRNKIYLMLTLYSMDLEEPWVDPLKRGMTPTNTFRVSGIDPSTTTRDIVSCLSNHYEERRLNYEIVWVDDTTFMVATRYTPQQQVVVLDGADRNQQQDPFDDDSIMVALDRDGQVVLEALQVRFVNQSIVTLEEHLKNVAAQQEKEERERQRGSNWLPMWASRAWNHIVGGRKRSLSDERDMEQADPKRQRFG